jgi:hypothetical protein
MPGKVQPTVDAFASWESVPAAPPPQRYGTDVESSAKNRPRYPTAVSPIVTVDS